MFLSRGRALGWRRLAEVHPSQLHRREQGRVEVEADSAQAKG